jgi:hypothetical protein
LILSPLKGTNRDGRQMKKQKQKKIGTERGTADNPRQLERRGQAIFSEEETAGGMAQARND